MKVGKSMVKIYEKIVNALKNIVKNNAESKHGLHRKLTKETLMLFRKRIK